MTTTKEELRQRIAHLEQELAGMAAQLEAVEAIPPTEITREDAQAKGRALVRARTEGKGSRSRKPQAEVKPVKEVVKADLQKPVREVMARHRDHSKRIQDMIDSEA